MGIIFAPAYGVDRFILCHLAVSIDFGAVAQSVEQRTENPCVGGSIPPLGTILVEFIICSS